MAARKTEATGHGLRLTLPGAPASPHTLAGHPGFYWPDRPTPVGAPGDPMTLDQARALAGDPGCPVELVDIPNPDQERARYQDDVRAQATGLRDARRTADGDEHAVITDQLAAASIEED